MEVAAMLIASCLALWSLVFSCNFPGLSSLHIYYAYLYLPTDFVQIPLSQRDIVLLASRFLPLPLLPPSFDPIPSSLLYGKGVVTIIW